MNPYTSDQFDLYTGNANPELARKIARYLGRELGNVEVFEFSNENIFVKIEQNVREQGCLRRPAVQLARSAPRSWSC